MDFKSLFDVTDKVVLVTGGSRGIGEMITTGFVQGGAKVYISSRSADVCEEVASKLTALGPGKCLALPGDLCNEEGCQKIMKDLSECEDHLDVLVNNAGIGENFPFEEHSTEVFKKVLNINLVSVFTLTQSCLPLLKAKATKDFPSRVINIGSVHGIYAPAVQTFGYSTSKAALHQLTSHLSRNLGQKHILVNAIAPGFFHTPMLDEPVKKMGDVLRGASPLNRMGTPEDIAGTCIYLASRAGQFTVGTVIVLDGGALPNLAIF
ncbi:unnamed protein product [Rhizopus stolonifer]